MTTYRLQSSSLVYAPGLIAWAINGYAFENDRLQLLRTITESFPSLPAKAADSLLSEITPFSIENDAVVFTVEDA